MSYSVFISYSMSDSSWAYDLSAQLGRKENHVLPRLQYFVQAALKNVDGAKEMVEKLKNGEKL